jgi:flagellar motor component MotA
MLMAGNKFLGPLKNKIRKHEKHEIYAMSVICEQLAENLSASPHVLKTGSAYNPRI